MMMTRVLRVKNAMCEEKIGCFGRDWLRTFPKKRINSTALAVNKSPCVRCPNCGRGRSCHPQPCPASTRSRGIRTPHASTVNSHPTERVPGHRGGHRAGQTCRVDPASTHAGSRTPACANFRHISEGYCDATLDSHTLRLSVDVHTRPCSGMCGFVKQLAPARCVA